MSGTPEADLTLLHGSIKTAIQTQFPDLVEVSFYERKNRRLSTPSLYFELEEMELATDSGEEQFNVMLHFGAYVVVSFKEPLAKLSARIRAMNIAAFIQRNRFASPLGPAMIKGVYPDDFNNAFGGDLEHDAYEVMYIGWTHEAAVGTSVWDGDPLTINEIWLGIYPEIGPEHEDEYILLNPETLQTIYVLEDSEGYIFEDSEGYILADIQTDLDPDQILEDSEGHILEDSEGYLLTA